jgi:hypothetical protein
VFRGLRPWVFNLLHAPHSWLDLFHQQGEAATCLDAEWRKVLSNKQAFEKDGQVIENKGFSGPYRDHPNYGWRASAVSD